MRARHVAEPRDGRYARFAARPHPPSQSGPTGLQPLGLDVRRDGFVYVPAGYTPDAPVPAVLMLHGAGGTGHNSLSPLLPLADAAGLILLGPDARLTTWDVLHGEYGPDIAFIDRALAQTFDRYAVDPDRLAVGGFSDGASYALSIGIGNGDLFQDIIAFSPGFMAPADQIGAPRIFISHGTHDRTLPIDACSRRIVPQLEGAEYDVTYIEFNGSHTVPPEIAADAVEWFLA